MPGDRAPDEDYPLGIPEVLAGRDLDATSPSDISPPPEISREDGTGRLAALAVRIADGDAARAERAELIAELGRPHSGWTQEDIAKAAGISQAAVSKSLAATPGARALATERGAAYLVGRLLGVALHLARRRDGLASEQAADKMASGRLPLTGTTVARLQSLLARDLALPGVPAAYRTETAEITAWLEEAGSLPALPAASRARGEVTLGLHHQSAALTRALAAAARISAN